MTDRELLTYAAKAAGIKARWFKVKKWRDYPASRILCGHDDVFGTHHSKPWNPLTDDGDALRLAVKLNLLLGPEFSHYLSLERFAHQDQDDAFATRRAIVRAAAEIGRAM